MALVLIVIQDHPKCSELVAIDLNSGQRRLIERTEHHLALPTIASVEGCLYRLSDGAPHTLIRHHLASGGRSEVPLDEAFKGRPTQIALAPGGTAICILYRDAEGVGRVYVFKLSQRDAPLELTLVCGNEMPDGVTLDHPMFLASDSRLLVMVGGDEHTYGLGLLNTHRSGQTEQVAPGAEISGRLERFETELRYQRDHRPLVDPLGAQAWLVGRDSDSVDSLVHLDIPNRSARLVEGGAKGVVCFPPNGADTALLYGDDHRIFQAHESTVNIVCNVAPHVRLMGLVRGALPDTWIYLAEGKLERWLRTLDLSAGELYTALKAPVEAGWRLVDYLRLPEGVSDEFEHLPSLEVIAEPGRAVGLDLTYTMDARALVGPQDGDAAGSEHADDDLDDIFASHTDYTDAHDGFDGMFALRQTTGGQLAKARELVAQKRPVEDVQTLQRSENSLVSPMRKPTLKKVENKADGADERPAKGAAQKPGGQPAQPGVQGCSHDGVAIDARAATVGLSALPASSETDVSLAEGTVADGELGAHSIDQTANSEDMPSDVSSELEGSETTSVVEASDTHTASLLEDVANAEGEISTRDSVVRASSVAVAPVGDAGPKTGLPMAEQRLDQANVDQPTNAVIDERMRPDDDKRRGQRVDDSVGKPIDGQFIDAVTSVDTRLGQRQMVSAIESSADVETPAAQDKQPRSDVEPTRGANNDETSVMTPIDDMDHTDGTEADEAAKPVRDDDVWTSAPSAISPEDVGLGSVDSLSSTERFQGLQSNAAEVKTEEPADDSTPSPTEDFSVWMAWVANSPEPLDTLGALSEYAHDNLVRQGVLDFLKGIRERDTLDESVARMLVLAVSAVGLLKVQAANTELTNMCREAFDRIKANGGIPELEEHFAMAALRALKSSRGRFSPPAVFSEYESVINQATQLGETEGEKKARRFLGLVSKKYRAALAKLVDSPEANRVEEPERSTAKPQTEDRPRVLGELLDDYEFPDESTDDTDASPQDSAPSTTAPSQANALSELELNPEASHGDTDIGGGFRAALSVPATGAVRYTLTFFGCVAFVLGLGLAILGIRLHPVVPVLGGLLLVGGVGLFGAKRGGWLLGNTALLINAAVFAVYPQFALLPPEVLPSGIYALSGVCGLSLIILNQRSIRHQLAKRTYADEDDWDR